VLQELLRYLLADLDQLRLLHLRQLVLVALLAAVDDHPADVVVGQGGERVPEELALDLPCCVPLPWHVADEALDAHGRVVLPLDAELRPAGYREVLDLVLPEAEGLSSEDALQVAEAAVLLLG
jgi:hypothetical protein